MANLEMVLAAAKKACPTNQTHRSIYIVGFNEGFDQGKDFVVNWLKEHIDDYIDCYSDRCQLLRDLDKISEE